MTPRTVSTFSYMQNNCRASVWTKAPLAKIGLIHGPGVDLINYRLSNGFVIIQVSAKTVYGPLIKDKWVLHEDYGDVKSSLELHSLKLYYQSSYNLKSNFYHRILPRFS